MEPKLLKQGDVDFIPQMYLGANFSGWSAVGDRVLVCSDAASSKSKGGVELTQDYTFRHTQAAITGVIIECGDEAFKWNGDRTRPFEGLKPKPGDRVIFERYAGSPIVGDDGKLYRLMDDKCIGGMKKRKQ